MGTTSTPVLTQATDAVRKSMSTAVAIADAKLRAMSPTYNISVCDQRMLTGEGGCEWTIRFLNDQSSKWRTITLNSIMKDVRPSLSHVWELKTARHNRAIRMIPAEGSFEDINAAQKSHAPRAVALVITVVVIFLLAIWLGLV